MEIVKTHIVYNKKNVLGTFIKVAETIDGKYFREIGSDDLYSSLYEQISTDDFIKMLSDYNNKII